MSNSANWTTCRIVCWAISAFVGLLSFWITPGPINFFAALLVGVALAVFLGLVVTRLFCHEDTIADGTEGGMPGSELADMAKQAGAPVAEKAAEFASSASNKVKEIGEAVSEQTSKVASAGAEKAKEIGEAVSEQAGKITDVGAGKAKELGEAVSERVSKVATAGTEQARELGATATESLKDAARKAGIAAAESAEAVSPVPDASVPLATATGGETGEGTRPEALSGPRAGDADDLKRIKGVGPKLEEQLNALGFYHFDQIAGWTAEEVAWVDGNLKGFKGRVSRDGWVEQAKTLASGGETEFSKRVEDGDVY